ncbi:JmjC domain-containing protein, partial [Klebsiella pneumoniae]|uniref:JmjC domain-containing protein n=1 Tax=Klebsiella pneumoniae TaxID=573 RepID=UPI0029FF4857
EVFRLANHIDHHGAQTFEFILFNPARMLAAGEVRIAVVLAAELVRPFRVLPDWRLDDLMISFSVPGGGVGPHIDQYDVFII